MSFPGKWMQPEMTALIRLSPTQEEKYYMFPLIYGNYTRVTHVIVCVCVLCVCDTKMETCL